MEVYSFVIIRYEVLSKLEDIISFCADVTTCFLFCVIFISGNCVFACLLLEKGQIWQVFAPCLLMLMVMQ